MAVLTVCVGRGGGSENGSDTTDAAGDAALALSAFQYVEFAGERA